MALSEHGQEFRGALYVHIVSRHLGHLVGMLFVEDLVGT